MISQEIEAPRKNDPWETRLQERHHDIVTVPSWHRRLRVSPFV